MSTQPTENEGQQISLADAADELGVHYMTAYRYVRTGRMYATKRGGKWWVDQRDVDAVREEGTGIRSSPGEPRALLVEPFSQRLIAGDVGGCWDLVTDALRGGATPAEIHERLLTPAMVAVGERWAAGEITIAAEHRATATANRLIGQLGPLFRHPGRRRGSVLIGAVAGDPHSIPSAMLSDLLTDRHFDVVDLGANTPAESFIEVARETDDLVGIGVCVTLERRLDVAAETVAEIRAALPDTLLVVGGAAATADAGRFADLADAVTTSGEQACDAFESLRSSSTGERA